MKKTWQNHTLCYHNDGIYDDKKCSTIHTFGLWLEPALLEFKPINKNMIVKDYFKP